MQEFFVANNRVDIARNQIIREGEVIALEPKVLEVLKVLANHPGDVVSHDTLLSTVWPGVVVAPNALQRCIGQLRKALGDDGRSQKVIATHPKKGYSLLSPVTFRSETSTNTPITRIKKKTKLHWVGLTLFLAVAGLVIAINAVTSSRDSSMNFTRLTPLTATDASEFYSTFSPDGRYVAFSRKVQGLVSHIWLLDTASSKEIRLTETPGHYGKPTWSTDSKQLAFLEMDSCIIGCRPQRCAVVSQLFVPLALSTPQQVKPLSECLPIPLLGIDWVSETHIAAITHDGVRSDVLQIDSQTGEATRLLTASNSEFYSLSYSSAQNQLAIMQVKEGQKPSMFLYSLDAKITSKQVFTPPTRYNSNVRWAPVWKPKGDGFIFSAGPHLYSLDLDGNLCSQAIPTFVDISYPMFHPDGNSIAMTLGKVDRDIAELSLIVDDSKTSFEERIFARSILRENEAQYQPNGDRIAFFSRRSGTRQVWIEENGEVSQLSNFTDFFPEHFVWSPNGKHIAISTEKQVLLIDLEGKVESFQLPFSLTRLYQWLPNNRLLMQIEDDEGNKIVRFDMRNNTYAVVHYGKSVWAQSDKQTTWFIDGQRRLKHIEDGIISEVNENLNVALGPRFFLRNNQLILLSNDDHIRRFNIETSALDQLFYYPDTTLQLTDVSQNAERLLISKQLSAEKEIVLLTP